MPYPIAATMARGSKGQNAAPVPFVGAYDAIPNLVHVYEPARCTLSAYTGGALLRLRRDSDDAEADFSHVSASDPELDVAAITAWLAGSAGYIVSVYDQVSGDTITQAAEAAQPLFVANVQNGHAGPSFGGSGDHLQGPFTVGGELSQPHMSYAVAQLDASVVNNDTQCTMIDGGSIVGRMLLVKAASQTPDAWAINAGSSIYGSSANSNWNIWAALFNGASSQMWHNGTSQVTGDAGTQNVSTVTMGSRYDGGVSWKGPIVSFVISDPSHTDEQRLAMQAAINGYWGTY